MIDQKSVSVIIPVYNEEKTLVAVVSALIDQESIDEIICIDDGSTDRSRELLSAFGKKVKLVVHTRNRGKGAALANGIKRAKGEVLVFCDSDLVGITEANIKQLVRPLSTEVRSVLGLMRRPHEMAIFDELTGMRAYYRKDLLPHVLQITATRFGVELYLNHHFPVKKSKKVLLHKVYHFYKFEKMPANEALSAYIKEVLEVIKEKALLEGWWNEEWKQQLETLRTIKDWTTWEKAITKISNYRMTKLLKKYSREYIGRIQKILGIN